MELFDEFEEWYMMQASQLFINVLLLIVCYKKCLDSVAHNCWGPEWGSRPELIISHFNWDVNCLLLFLLFKIHWSETKSK